MTGNNPMSFFSDNVDAWGPLEWFDRLAKAVHARNRSVRDKDELSFELYQNIASSSATRLVSDFEDKVRMALTTLRELEKANVAYVDANTELLSALESLQRENEEKSAWIKAATVEITKAIGGGSEMFTKHGDDFRVDPAFVAAYIQFRRERHAESKKASIQKEREILARAEAAEAEVKRLSAPVVISCRCTKIAQDETCPVGYPSLLCEICDGKGVLPYVEMDGSELWEIVFGVNSDAATEITDAQFDQIAKAINDVFIAPLRVSTALASTGGEHHAE